MSATLFGACKKGDSGAGNYAVNPATTTNNTSTESNRDIPQNAVLIYSLMAALPASNGAVQWNSGTITVGEITFDGNTQLGNEMIRQHDRLVVNKSINLQPLSVAGNAIPLGSVSLPFGTYYEPVFGMLLAAIFPPANQTTTQPVALYFYFSGTSMLNGRSVPITLMISEPTGLTASAGNPITLAASREDYNVILSLNLDQALSGINANTLSSATLVNNGILISANANQNLYQMVLNNLGNSLKVTFEGSLAAPNPNTIPVSAPFPNQ